MRVNIKMNKQRAPVKASIKASVIQTPSTSDHRELLNRDAPDSHPILAITGLEEALNDKVSKQTFLTNTDIEELIGG